MQLKRAQPLGYSIPGVPIVHVVVRGSEYEKRFFLDRLATHILAAEGEGKWVWHEGNFAEYEAERIARQGDEPPRPIKYATLAS